MTTGAAAAYNEQMKRAPLAVLLAAGTLAVVGCGSSTALRSAPLQSRVSNHVSVAPETLRSAGPALTPLPAGYRPSRSWRTLLDGFRALRRDANALGKTSAHLWRVNGAYPAWVFTSTGRAGTSVGIYDLRGRRWTMSYSVGSRTAPCNGGMCGFPLNQGGLDMAAGYTERFPGDAHYFAGDSIDDRADRVILHLAHAPRSVIVALIASHPGTYVIHNDAPRTLAAVMAVEHALDWTALKSEGIDIVSAGPTQDGRLIVGVTKDIPKAQAYFDATYGPGFVHVVHGEPAVALAASGNSLG